jgi:hypothetical protein
MKTLTLLISLFLFSNVIAQNISPYQGKMVFSNKYETQITYVDLNHVSIKIQSFLSDKLDMQLDDTKYNLTDGVGEIISIYTEGIAINREPKSIRIIYNVFGIGHDFVIKEATISGDIDIVIRFFVRFWKTTLSFDNLKNGEIASYRFLQDKISFSDNVIKITNTAIKNVADFKPVIPGTSKVNYDHIKKEKTPVKVDKIKRRRYFYNVKKRKNSLKFEQTRKHFADKMGNSSEFKTGLNEFMKPYKKGIYLVTVVYTYTNKKLTEIEFNINK